VTTLVRQGKVRDVYDLGESLLIIATDRISAFDWILPTPIPDKGRILSQLSEFWFDYLNVEHHLLRSEVRSNEIPPGWTRDELAGRSMVVKKCRVVPFECVVRGYLVGSGWKDYQASGRLCGIQMEPGLQNCSRLPEPLFTPATKAEQGHDENVPFAQMVQELGDETAQWLRDKSLEVYAQASALAAARGIILADTKFEWGWHQGRLILIDEVLTPDSSRFWPADQYAPGRNQVSFDKQYVREYLESTAWDKNSPPPELPAEVVRATREKYVEAYERMTGRAFAS